LLHLLRFSGIIIRRSLVGGDMTSPSASVETQKVGGGYKLLAGIALAVVVCMALVILFSHRGFYNVYRFHQEWLRLEQENSRLAADNDRLARSIDRLQHDPEYIQDRIRQDLNFVKKNELIFQFPPEASGAAPHLIAATNGAAAPPAGTQAISERKTGAAKLSATPDGTSKKKGRRRRE
jgi:cell division protein FtsB